MTTQLRATGLSEEQRDALAAELEARGIGGWESAGEPRETIGEGDDAELAPQKYGFTIPVEGNTDVAALGSWLDRQYIAHVLEQPATSTGVVSQPAVDEEPEEPELPTTGDAPSAAPTDDAASAAPVTEPNTKEKDA